ncbi:MAG TPA: peptide chain release factor N(5)-glutamine methyltransferase [Rhizomicrobium sp.]|nr:peptide chain release factor N(5)-glutamine methyltransferase [Rhizomicrobium sp.]
MNDIVLEAARRLAAAGVESARLDARLLWEHAQKHGADFEGLVRRREGREPIAYITGHKEFWSLDFQVGPGVLIPRPDTETLIEETLRMVPDRKAPLRIADLGTGSAAILVAALTEFPNAAGIGFESSPEAFGWASGNAARLIGSRAEIRLTDWTGAEGPFDLVFSNPPYIPSAEIESLDADVWQFEPRAALDGGPDGLDAYRALAELLPVLVRPGGHALLEIGLGQANAVTQLFPNLEIVRVAPDLSGIPRCLTLRKP